LTRRSTQDYLQDILSTIEIAEQFVAGMTFSEFENDSKTIFAVARAIALVGRTSTT